MDLFSSSYPDISNVIGPFDFSLSGGGDQVRIFDNAGILIDSVQYDDADPWPLEPDGNVPTLELIYPGYDNTLAVSDIVSPLPKCVFSSSKIDTCPPS